MGREVQADFDNSEAEILREAAQQDRKRLKKERDFSGWKGFFFTMGIVVGCAAVIGSVCSLVINPSWHHVVLLLTVLATWIVVFVSNKRWIQILFLTACGIVVIYTIRGIILGNIKWFYPSGYGGP